MKVLFVPEVINYFLDLSNILYEKDYFGFEETAFEYVDELFEDIKTNLPDKQTKPAPPHFDRYKTEMRFCVKSDEPFILYIG